MSMMTNTIKTNVMNLELTRTEQVLYKFSYEFALETGKSVEEAHGDALRKVFKTRKMADDLKGEVWVDLSNGNRFKANF